MVLRDNFYHILSSEVHREEYSYTIVPDADHTIYKAHFPGEPITPGVCILQIALELLGLSLKKNLELKQVKNVKFLNILRPDGSPVEVKIHSLSIDGEEVKAKVDLKEEDTAIAKMSFICRIVL